METTISDLSLDLVEEILCRVPLTSLSKVRCASKQWNALSKDRVVCKAESKQQFLGFMRMKSRVFSVRFDSRNDEFADPSIKQIGKLAQFKVGKMFHCDVLVLCVTKDHSRLMVWNPYLGQTRLIEQMNFTFTSNYALGYDSSRSHKMVRFSTEYNANTNRHTDMYEIYDFDSDSDSWRVLDVSSDWYTESFYAHGVSLKGNAYWYAFDGRDTEEKWVGEYINDFLLYFDFTRERFGPGSLACVREEKLAILLKNKSSGKIHIWMTTKIEPEVVSWSMFFMFDLNSNKVIKYGIQYASFFIEEEKKVVVVFNMARPRGRPEIPWDNIAYMIKEDGYQKEVYLGSSSNYNYPVVCSYVPSLVQIE